MSDVRIERIEPCSHDIAKGHRIAGEMLWCDGEDRSVLDGLPPEAKDVAFRYLRNVEQNFGRIQRRDVGEALDLAWRVLTGEADDVG